MHGGTKVDRSGVFMAQPHILLKIVPELIELYESDILYCGIYMLSSPLGEGAGISWVRVVRSETDFLRNAGF